MSVIFSRYWSMPNPETFKIVPISNLLKRFINNGDIIIDPFARNSKIATYTNDLNPKSSADYHLEASDFLDELIKREIIADVVLFDPPYSPRQQSEIYQSIGIKPTMKHTQNACLYSSVRKRLNKLLKQGGIAISFGWNSNGFGKKFGYNLLEIMLVAHGGAHNDTIITVESKEKEIFD